ENYTVTMSRDITLSMKRVNNPNLIWLLRDTNGIPYEVEVDPSTKDVEFDGAKFVYNGKAYSIEVSEPSGYSVQGTIETVLEGTTTALNEIKNAGVYVTTVKLVKDGETSSTAYTIKWTIEKAVIDLSNVKWKYDGKLPYNGGKEVKAELEEGSIPEQLEPKYGGSQVGTSVGGSDGGGTVNVTFALKEGYRENYVLPEKDKDGSYTGSFEWSKAWEIVPATIKLEWVDSEAEDEEGNAFTVKKLADTTVDGIVEYVYYETDSNGRVKEPKVEVKLEDIRVSATERKYYVAVPSIKSGFENNYKFPDGAEGSALYSQFFTVGGGSNSAQVSLAKSEYEYNNGKAVKLQLAPIGVRESDLELT
ncbi:MAG: hypothetical protein K2H36_05855, partial [Clostridia bacterium]|nr:hypothetical protein [Clostridia bacterium]